MNLIPDHECWVHRKRMKYIRSDAKFHYFLHDSKEYKVKITKFKGYPIVNRFVIQTLSKNGLSFGCALARDGQNMREELDKALPPGSKHDFFGIGKDPARLNKIPLHQLFMDMLHVSGYVYVPCGQTIGRNNYSYQELDEQHFVNTIDGTMVFDKNGIKGIY